MRDGAECLIPVSLSVIGILLIKAWLHADFPSSESSPTVTSDNITSTVKIHIYTYIWWSRHSVCNLLNTFLIFPYQPVNNAPLFTSCPVMCWPLITMWIKAPGQYEVVTFDFSSITTITWMHRSQETNTHKTRAVQDTLLSFLNGSTEKRSDFFCNHQLW